MGAAIWQGTALLLNVHVQPGAATDEVVGMHGDRLKVRIKAPPVDGKANLHLIEFLAHLFGVPRSQVHLVRGESGRAKTVRIDGPLRIPEGFGLEKRET